MRVGNAAQAHVEGFTCRPASSRAIYPVKTRLTPPEIRDYRAHMREETLPARSLQQHVRKTLTQHAIKRLFSAILRSLGELFRAHARIKASQGEFAHRTQRPGDAETNNTTARPRHGTTETTITSAHPPTRHR